MTPTLTNILSHWNHALYPLEPYVGLCGGNFLKPKAKNKFHRRKLTYIYYYEHGFGTYFLPLLTWSADATVVSGISVSSHRDSVCCSLAQTRLLEMCYIRYLIKGITCPLICFLLFNIIGATATFRPLDFWRAFRSVHRKWTDKACWHTCPIILETWF